MPGTIGILTGGGDAPGLNAVIRAVVTTAIGQYGMRVIGIEDGFEGLLGETHTHELTTADVRGLLPRGGTILGTRNRGRFVDRDASGKAIKVDALYHEATENLRRLGIDALVVLGGEGTLTIAQEFGRFGIPVPHAASDELLPDVLLVPMLAFDRAGFRLGYGGGFYDRTVAWLRQVKPIVAVGIAYAAQEVAAVPRGRYDQPLDWIVTEVGAFQPMLDHAVDRAP